MTIPDDRSTFPSTLGAGIPTDLQHVPGGPGAQPYKADKAITKLVPKMTVPDAQGANANMGVQIPDDMEHAPGGTARNPLFGGPQGPGYNKTNVGTKTASVRGRYIRSLTKIAQDPTSPQPSIGGKVGGDDPQVPGTGYFATPSEEGVPAVGSDPSNAGRKWIANNTAPVQAKPRDLSIQTQRPEMAQLLSQPMQRAQFDSKVRENLSAIEDQAGPKLASVSPTKAAIGRALLKKLASAGAETGRGPENVTGTDEDKEKEARARELGKKAGKKAGSEKTGQMPAAPSVAGSSVAPTMGQPGGIL